MTLEHWNGNPHDVSLQFLRQLNSSEGYVLEAAARELRDAPPKVLMRLLQEETTLRIQAETRAVPYLLGVLACLVTAVIATVFYLPQWLRVTGSMFLVLDFYAALILAIRGMGIRASRQLRARSEQAREQLCAAVRANRDPALIRLILERLEASVVVTHIEPFPSYCIALEHLLPVLNATERQVVTRRYVRLCTLLLRETQVSDGLKINILALVEEAGASEYTGEVKSLLHANPELELTFAAQRCLEALQQREADAKQSAMLLRASNANATSPETLLRPVTQTEDAKPEQLLRPSQN